VGQEAALPGSRTDGVIARKRQSGGSVTLGRLNYVVVCLLGLNSLCAAEHTLAGQLVRSLLPDLSFHYVCKAGLRGDIEKRTQLFLRANGFRVLNLADIQHQHDIHFFDTNILALDRDQRMIEIRSVPRADQRYSFGLYSQPPTSHSVALERDILNFISVDLGCESRQIRRNQNREEQKEFYESELRRARGLFEEADRINGGRHI
jgi:hypothetical protein